MPVISYVFFAAFALIIMATYIAVRRGLGNIRVVAAVCMIGSVITMMLSQVARVGIGGNPVAAGLIGAVLGALGGAAVLALAWYFHSQELRKVARE
jgi:hypothetical protein